MKNLPRLFAFIVVDLALITMLVLLLFVGHGTSSTKPVTKIAPTVQPTRTTQPTPPPVSTQASSTSIAIVAQSVPIKHVNVSISGEALWGDIIANTSPQIITLTIYPNNGDAQSDATDAATVADKLSKNIPATVGNPQVYLSKTAYAQFGGFQPLVRGVTIVVYSPDLNP